MNKRLDWLDSLKGFLMILVIWGHFFPPENVGIWIYSFHMPLFFMISGFLKKQRSATETIQIKSKSLLIPYTITAIVSFILGIFLYKGMGMDIPMKEQILNLFYLNGSVGWNTPIWFLIVLFELEVFFSIIHTKKQQKISLFIFTILGYFIYQFKIILPFGLHVFVWAAIFYVVGMLIKQISFKKALKKQVSVALFVLILIINIIFNNLQNEITAMYHSQLGNYWLFLLNGIMMSLALFFWFQKFSINNKFLRLMSRYSLVIMCTHYLFYMFYRVLDKLFFNHYLLSYELVPSIINTMFCLAIYTVVYYLYINFLKKNKRT